MHKLTCCMHNTKQILALRALLRSRNPASVEGGLAEDHTTAHKVNLHKLAQHLDGKK